jgi:hypothetical protein
LGSYGVFEALISTNFLPAFYDLGYFKSMCRLFRGSELSFSVPLFEPSCSYSLVCAGEVRIWLQGFSLCLLKQTFRTLFIYFIDKTMHKKEFTIED